MSRKKKDSQSKKYERQKMMTAERVKRFRAKMTAEQWEDKRRKERERYYRKKAGNLIKPVSEMNERDQRKIRKAWRKNSQKYRNRKKAEKEVLDCTPPQSEDENDILQRSNSSLQRKRGRKYVKRDRSKAYRKIQKQKDEIKDLKKQVAKYKKRLYRNVTKSKNLDSPSPNAKVKQLIGREKVSPHVKKRLFLGYALEKQLMSQKKQIKPHSNAARTFHKVIGTKVLKKYRVQKYFKNLVTYKMSTHQNGNFLDHQRKLSQCKTAKLKNRLLEYFEDDAVSKMCPGKRDFKRKGKKKKQRRILLDTLQNLWKRFVAESKIKISYSTFARARPFWVTQPTAKDRETCACILHSNMEFLVSALSAVKAINFKSCSEAVNATVCSKDYENCMIGKCENCEKKMVVFNDNISDQTNVKYYQWKTDQEKKVIKGVPRVIKKMRKVKLVAQLVVLKKRLNAMMTRFKKHTFDMLHQAQQKKYLKGNLFGRELMFMLDFSENYCVKYESEVQAMHFGASKKQITLHTIVLYYNNGEKIVPHSFCTVSDNLAHQSYAVWAHLDPVLEYVSKRFPQTEKVHFFSDSPSSQYRNRSNLYLLKKSLANYFPLIQFYSWNFSEPGHGKGAMDGVGGALKRKSDELVCHGHDITCAGDIVKNFKDSKVTVIEVSDENIEMMRRKLPINIAPVKNIMKIKQVVGSIKDDTMQGRSLSCFLCPPNEDCEHYGMANIFSPNLVYFKNSSPPQKKPDSKQPPTPRKKPHFKRPPPPRKKQDDKQPLPPQKKLCVEEVYSSSDEEDAQQNGDQPGSSNSNRKTPFMCSEVIKPGTYVLVRYEQTSKKSQQPQQFVGICQTETDDFELEVMFLKSVSKDKTTFCVNESDNSFVARDQVVATLTPPSIIMKGDRVYYKFKYPISVS